MHRYWNIAEKRRIRLRSKETVLEGFLTLCAEMKSAAVCWDEQLGVLSYSQMYKSIIALAMKVSKYPDEYIGVMMPSSAGAYVAYFAVLLAGKTPVMINWSQGYREVCTCVDLVKVRHVLSSQQLVQHMKMSHGENVEYPFTVIPMENVRQELTWTDKCKIGFYLSLPVRWVLKLFGVLDKKSSDVAVILFTSGTEKFPKVVPLTNSSLMANQQACLQFFDPTETDVMLSFLPPFHAFGFNCCSLFPLLAGFPIAFSYNPLHPKKVVEFIEQSRATFLGSTPLFFDYLLHAAKKAGAQLSSLRCVVIGGEAFRDNLRAEAVQAFPHIAFRQGYGVSECSPVIAINVPDSPAIESCVGMPIQGMEVIILEENTLAPQPTGKEGLVVVRGSSLFPGYLGASDPNQGFIEKDGKRWYVTGDLGYLDERGELFLKGRLSRFVKIGGEMVSLEAMESILRDGFSKTWDAGKDSLVVCGVSGATKVRLCLFTTFPTTLQEVNDILKNSKTSNIMRVSFLHQLDAIPLLGTGKPAYGTLNVRARALFGEEE